MPVHLREAETTDLATINGVVRAAIATWGMPERLFRLVLPTYEYEIHDFLTMRLYVAETGNALPMAVLALENVQTAEPGTGQKVLLLHGIYVLPEHQGKGLGRELVNRTLDLAAREGEYDGVLVKSHASARYFFTRTGFTELPVTDNHRDYPHRYWWPLTERNS